MVDLETSKKKMKSKKRGDKMQIDESEPPTKKSKKRNQKTKDANTNESNESTNEETILKADSKNEILETENKKPSDHSAGKEKKKRKNKNPKKQNEDNLQETVEESELAEENTNEPIKESDKKIKKRKDKKKNKSDEALNVDEEKTKENASQSIDESANKVDKTKKKKKDKKKKKKKPSKPLPVVISPNDLSIEELEARILEIKNRPTITNTAKRKLGSLKRILRGKKEIASQSTPVTNEGTPATNEDHEDTPATNEIDPIETNETIVKTIQDPKNKSKLNKKNTRFCVFVGNISYNTTKEEIQEHFSKVGDIVDVRIPPPKKGESKPRGFAYVELKDKHGYEKSMELHHSFLAGRRINVFYTTGNKNKNPEQQKKEIQKKNFKLSAMRNKGLFREENKTVPK